VADDPYLLVGEWQLERRLVDRDTGQFGRVLGRTTISPSDGGITWAEQGELAWDGRTIAVTRRLRLLPSAAGWWMHFEDGRPFHPWRPGEFVDHPCADDHYRGLIEVAPGIIRTLWDVTGPRKSQRIVTRLRREPQLSPA
jgi:Family of unknown function (DUF6314)